jgi:hypothetical protein
MADDGFEIRVGSLMRDAFKTGSGFTLERESVRDPSTSFALLPSVGMT